MSSPDKASNFAAECMANCESLVAPRAPFRQAQRNQPKLDLKAIPKFLTSELSPIESAWFEETSEPIRAGKNLVVIASSTGAKASHAPGTTLYK